MAAHFLQSLDRDQRLLRLELLGLGLGQMQGQDAVLKLSADVLGLQFLADIEAACAAAGSTLLADIAALVVLVIQLLIALGADVR